MQFVYKPEGVKPRAWDFNPDKMMNVECMEIERRTGWDFGEWLKRFKAANMTAITAYLYVMMKREEPGIKYDMVAFTMDEIAFEPTEAELAETRHALEEKLAAEGLEPAEQALLDQLVADGVTGVEPAPKD